MTKTLGVIVFDEERPLTLMVFNVRDVACRHHFPFISTLSTIGFLDEPVSFDSFPDWWLVPGAPWMLRFASAVFAIYECDVMPVHEDDHLLFLDIWVGGWQGKNCSAWKCLVKASLVTSPSRRPPSRPHWKTAMFRRQDRFALSKALPTLANGGSRRYVTQSPVPDWLTMMSW